MPRTEPEGRVRRVERPVGGIVEPEDRFTRLPSGVPIRSARNVLANPRFLSLYLSQVLTQVGGNIVLSGLTVTVTVLTGQASSTGLLLLTLFLVPAVLFGAIASIYSDQLDHAAKSIMACNVGPARALLHPHCCSRRIDVLAPVCLSPRAAIVATLTTFFGQPEAAMIPSVVDIASS